MTHDAQRLEQTLVAEREQRIALEEALTQVQEQLRLQEHQGLQEVIYLGILAGAAKPNNINSLI